MNKNQKQMKRFISGVLCVELTDGNIDKAEDISKNHANIIVYEHCKQYYMESNSYFYNFYCLINDPKKKKNYC